MNYDYESSNTFPRVSHYRDDWLANNGRMVRQKTQERLNLLKVSIKLTFFLTDQNK